MSNALVVTRAYICYPQSAHLLPGLALCVYLRGHVAENHADQAKLPTLGRRHISSTSSGNLPAVIDQNSLFTASS